jgi:hypothetical protein
VLALATACVSSDASNDAARTEDSTDAATGPGPADPGPTDGIGETTGSTSTGPDPDAEASTDTEGETDDGVDPTPPPVSEACDAPTGGVVESFAADDAQRFDAIALSWNGTTTGLAYAESTGELTWTIWLQRLDGAGSVAGDRIALGTATLTEDPVGPLPRPWLSSTSIGPSVVTCWTGADAGDAIACAAVLEDGTLAAGVTAPGKNPAVATGPAGVGLVYSEGNAFVSRRLDHEGLAAEEPHEVFTVSGTELDVRPVLAASSVGYVSGADLLLPRFDAAFDELEGQAILGWTSLPVSIAGSDDVIGAAWGSLDGVQVRVLGADDEDFAQPVRVDGLDGSTSAATTAITRGDGSFATVWSVDASLMYAPIDPSGELRAAASRTVDLSTRSDALGVTGVAQGFVAAAVTGSSGQELVVAFLDCS